MSVPLIPQITVLSYKLYIKAANSQMVQIGQVQNLTVAERRDVTPNFVIGNDPPDQASNLIPGVVKTRTATLSRVRLYSQSLKEVFGTDSQTAISSLTYQSSPVDLVATILNPNTNQTKTITWKDGFLSDVDSKLDMNGDIREIESCTFVYLSVVETPFA